MQQKVIHVNNILDNILIVQVTLIYSCYLQTGYASVNSTCAQPQPLPPPPRGDPWALAFFLPWMTNSQGWGLLSCQILRGGDEKRGQMPRPSSTLQHFSLIAQSNSRHLSISVWDFLLQLTSSFVIALGF